MNEQNGKDRFWQAIATVKNHIANLFQMCKENKNIVMIVTGFVVAAVAVVCIGSIIERNNEIAAAAIVEETAEAGETGEDVISVPEEVLEIDAYPEVNNLVKQYYQALTDGDMDTIRSIKSYTDAKEEITILKKSEFIESYPTITVYTKKGPEEGSFVAYVYYEVKFLDYEGTAPGLNTLYICSREDGTYYINDNELGEADIEYLKTVSAQNDVIDLFNTVQVQYNEVKANDEGLSAFLDELPNLLTESVGAAMAELEETEETQNQEEETEPEVIVVVTKVKTTDVVNVRSSDSIEADKIGQTTQGQVLELIEEKVNGWSKVNFEGQEGYIKSEFLEPEETETVANPEAEPETTKEDTSVEEETTSEETDEDADSEEETVEEVSTTAGKVTDTVNVRKTPGTDGEKLGQISKGSSIEIIEKQSDGWTKIKYNDGEAYVKSDYVE